MTHSSLIVAALLLLMLSASGCSVHAPSRPGSWQQGGRLMTPRDDFGLVAVGGRLWAVGGMTGARGNVLDSVESFDVTTGRWSVEPPMPTARSSAGVAAIDTSIYVVGGLAPDGEVSAAVEVFDTAARTWSRRSPLPLPRMQLAAVAVNGEIWAIGGNSGGPPTAAVDIYNPETDRWRPADPMPTPRYSLAATVFDRKVYAVGGQTERGSVTAVELADPAHPGWIAGPPLPEGLTRLGLSPLGGHLHALEGSTHVRLRSGGRAWERLVATPTPRHGLSTAVLGDQLYAVGGCSSDWIDVAINEIYRPG